MEARRARRGELPFFARKREALLQGDPRKLQLKVVIGRVQSCEIPQLD
jgi:hypothetical protein